MTGHCSFQLVAQAAKLPLLACEVCCKPSVELLEPIPAREQQTYAFAVVSCLDDVDLVCVKIEQNFVSDSQANRTVGSTHAQADPHEISDTLFSARLQ